MALEAGLAAEVVPSLADGAAAITGEDGCMLGVALAASARLCTAWAAALTMLPPATTANARLVGLAPPPPIPVPVPVPPSGCRFLH